MAYLAHRLGVEVSTVPVPATPGAGIKALTYFDPPPKQSANPIPIGDYPCAVFGTVAADGKRHAHRIYLAPGGAGKADLPPHEDGSPRDPKKSARAQEGDNTAGRSVLWGDPAAAPWIITCEGVETGAALAFAFRPDIEVGAVVVAAEITAGGVEAFQPYPATKRITVAADRDETAKPGKAAPSRRGEKAARTFGLRHYETLQVDTALPGQPGESIDWLDILRRDGADAVRAGIAGAVPFAPTPDELIQDDDPDSAAWHVMRWPPGYRLTAGGLVLRQGRRRRGNPPLRSVHGSGPCARSERQWLGGGRRVARPGRQPASRLRRVRRSDRRRLRRIPAIGFGRALGPA